MLNYFPKASFTRCNLSCNLSSNFGKRNPFQVARDMLHAAISGCYALVIFFPDRAVPGTVEEIPGGLRDFTHLPFPTAGKIWHLSRVARPHSRVFTELLLWRDSNPGEHAQLYVTEKKSSTQYHRKDFRSNHLTQGFPDRCFNCEVWEHFLFVGSFHFLSLPPIRKSLDKPCTFRIF